MVQQNSCEGSWIQTVSVPSFLPRDCKLDGAGTLVRAIVRGEGLIPPTEKSFPWAGKKKIIRGCIFSRVYLLQKSSYGAMDRLCFHFLSCGVFLQEFLLNNLRQ